MNLATPTPVTALAASALERSRILAPVLTLAAAAVVLAGCAREKFGTVLHENAEVADVCFVPAGHGGQYGYGFERATLRPVYSYENTDIPPAFAIVMKCAHGKFVVDGALAAWVAGHFKVGDKVTVQYREVLVDTGTRGERAVAVQYVGVVAGVDKTPPLLPPNSF